MICAIAWGGRGGKKWGRGQRKVGSEERREGEGGIGMG